MSCSSPWLIVESSHIHVLLVLQQNLWNLTFVIRFSYSGLMDTRKTRSFSNSPRKPYDAIVFTQHGWSDDGKQIGILGKILTESATDGKRLLLVNPSLNWFMTWLKMEPLIAQLVEIIHDTLDRCNVTDSTPWYIVGHSMGGLLWVEVLNRHPEWVERVNCMVFLGSPLGGADLARILQPLSFGIGIATDLGTSRRSIAQELARTVPTLSIAGDVDGGSDTCVLVGSTHIKHAHLVTLKGISHTDMRSNEHVAAIIKTFWNDPWSCQKLSATVDALPNGEIIAFAQDAAAEEEEEERQEDVRDHTDNDRTEKKKAQKINGTDNNSTQSSWSSSVDLSSPLLSSSAPSAENIMRKSMSKAVRRVRRPITNKIIQDLREVKWITDAHYRDLSRVSQRLFDVAGEQVSVWTWRNVFQVQHVFIKDEETSECLYAGFVGWKHNDEFRNTLTEIMNSVLGNQEKQDEKS